MKPTICLIAPGHISSTPRLVKAADALYNDGYSVHVVAGCPFPPANVFDEAIRRRWLLTRVPYHAGTMATLRRIRRRITRRRLARNPSLSALALDALHIGIRPLATAAAKIPAAIYIGHGGVAGLAAAALAATARKCSLGFDAEDWHPGETDFVCNDPAERAAVDHLLRCHIPRLSLFTCASPLIGQAFADRYGRMPVNVLNVFPRSEAPLTPTTIKPITKDDPAVLYWFSQTIGPGRGLEEAVDLVGHLKSPAILRLRGRAIPGYAEALQARLNGFSSNQKLEILASAPPSEMAPLASSAHLGLSIELRTPPNHNLCLANKIFTYLLAGLPQLLSRTDAHLALAPTLGSAAIVMEPGNAKDNARLVDDFISDPTRMLSARAHAWTLASQKFCWEAESQKLLQAVDLALAAAPVEQ